MRNIWRTFLESRAESALLTIIFLTIMVLLISVCWQYIRHGRFPSLRVVRT